MEGVVRDSSGASVLGAQVELHANSYTVSITTDSAGDFAFDHVSEGSGTVLVSAKGSIRSKKTGLSQPETLGLKSL